MKALRRRDKRPILFLTSALDECGWLTPRPGRFIPGNKPVLIVWEAEWAPGPVWMGAEEEIEAYSFLNLGARWAWVVNATSRSFYPREQTGTHCMGGWVGPRAGMDGCRKSAPFAIRSPDRPARSQSLYSLRYPKQRKKYVMNNLVEEWRNRERKNLTSMEKKTTELGGKKRRGYL